MKIGILISGRGSNMAALLAAIDAGTIAGAEAAVVISDRADAAGLKKAADAGVETLVLDRRGRPRAEHDTEIAEALTARQVDLVCLAGYMRLLSPEFIKRFADRIVNIHPSLLPAFPGLDAQRQAVEYGVKVSGCTVHFVDEHLDHGPIILQRSVTVSDDDTEESLSAKILELEHECYVSAVQMLAAGKIIIDGRRTLKK